MDALSTATSDDVTTSVDAGPASDPLLAIDAMTNLRHPVKTEMARWAQEQLDCGDIIERDASGTFWREGWQRAADRGILGLGVDEEYGGAGHDLVAALLAFEGLGYGCDDGGLVFALACQVWTMQPMIQRFGSAEQRQRYLPGLVSGEIAGAFTITELDSGSDTFAMRTTFAPAPGEATDAYVLNGRKAYVTMAPDADVFVVFATADPDQGSWGVSVFLVDRDSPGLDVQPTRSKMGLRTSPFADVVFDNCVVPAEQRIGPLGSGAAIFSAAMESERAFVLAGQIGAMERQLDNAVAYARERQQFGQAIANFQSVSHRLADMKLRHENARNLLYKAAAISTRGDSSMETAALAKIQASEAAVTNSVDALLTHGARGYLTEHGVERDLRDFAGGIVYGGTSDIQRNIVARMLGLG